MDPFSKFYISAIHFLKYRNRSEKEVRDNLKKKKAPPEIIEQVIIKLKEQKFVNDSEFVKWWIEQRTQFNPGSLRLIKQELRLKGISDETIENTITNYKPASPAGRLLITNDKDQAKKLIEKKLPRLRNLPDDKKREKLMRLLATRGFNYDTIIDVLKETVDE